MAILLLKKIAQFILRAKTWQKRLAKFSSKEINQSLLFKKSKVVLENKNWIQQPYSNLSGLFPIRFDN